jgi:hypothetical protein
VDNKKLSKALDEFEKDLLALACVCFGNPKKCTRCRTLANIASIREEFLPTIDVSAKVPNDERLTRRAI